MEKFKGNGFEISRLGLGCMRMSVPFPANRKESIETIRNALDAGINLLNTGDFYGLNGHNEKLIAEAIEGYPREEIFISLKYGRFNPLLRRMDVGPKNIRKHIENSLKNLNTDYVDLYQPARIDMGIPLEETIGAIADLIDDGYVRFLGLSEVDAEILKKAHDIHPVALVECEVSIANNEIDKDIIPTAEELGIGIVGFGVMGFGKFLKKEYENDLLIKTVKEIAVEKGATVSQILYAWVLRKSDNIIPLIGTTKVEHLKNCMGCLNIDFTKEERTRILTAMRSSKIMGRVMPKLVVKNGKMIMEH